jgi:hypothetical protein
MVAFRDPESPDDEKDAVLIARLKSSEGLQLQIMSEISEEREKLRKSMMAFGEACVEAPYGSDITAFALPSIMASLKVCGCILPAT